MRTDPALPLQFRQLQRRTQFKQRIAANHGSQERRIGLQERIDGPEHGRQVVDPVQGEGGEHRGKGVRPVREHGGRGEQRLFVDRNALNLEWRRLVLLRPWFGVVAVEKRGGEVGAGDFFDAWEQLRVRRVGQDGFGNVAGAGAEVENVRNWTADELLGC